MLLYEINVTKHDYTICEIIIYARIYIELKNRVDTICSNIARIVKEHEFFFLLSFFRGISHVDSFRSIFSWYREFAQVSLSFFLTPPAPFLRLFFLSFSFCINGQTIRSSTKNRFCGKKASLAPALIYYSINTLSRKVLAMRALFSAAGVRKRKI